MPYEGGYDPTRSSDLGAYDENKYFTFKNRGVRWRGRESHAAWAQNNYIDERGMLQGDMPYVPHSLAHVVQAQHDTAVYKYRDQVMRDAIAESRGGRRLMQSYRPGGSAAIEANMYGQTAGLQMQRASMIQPMDLMSDYRRYVEHRARQKRKQAQRNNMWAGIGAAIGGYFAPQYVQAAQGHFQAATQLQQEPGTTSGTSMNVQGGGGPTSQGGGGGQGGTAPAQLQGGGGYGTISPGGMQAVQGMGGGGGGGGGGGYGTISPGGMQAVGGMGAMGAQLDGGGGGGGGVGGGGGGTGAGAAPSGEDGAGGPGGGSPMEGAGGMQAAATMGTAGQSGDFSPNARARESAAMTGDAGAMYLNEVAADAYESDPFYDQMDAAIQQQMLRRDYSASYTV